MAALLEPPREAVRTDFQDPSKVSFKIGRNRIGKRGGPAVLYWGELEPVCVKFTWKSVWTPYKKELSKIWNCLRTEHVLRTGGST